MHSLHSGPSFPKEFNTGEQKNRTDVEALAWHAAVWVIDLVQILGAIWSLNTARGHSWSQRQKPPLDVALPYFKSLRQSLYIESREQLSWSRKGHGDTSLLKWWDLWLLGWLGRRLSQWQRNQTERRGSECTSANLPQKRVWKVKDENQLALRTYSLPGILSRTFQKWYYLILMKSLWGSIAIHIGQR